MIIRPLFALALLFAPAPLAAQDEEEILPQTLPVALNESDPAQTEIGELIYRGGLKIEPGEENIGGISGLEWVDNEQDYGGGALWAVSDDGRWLKIVPDEDAGRLTDIYSVHMDRLRDLNGKRLKKKADADAEAITRDQTNDAWLVAFEQDHRVWQYQDLRGAAAETNTRSDMAEALKLVTKAGPNSGLETLAVGENLGIACGEWTSGDRPNCIMASLGGVAKFALPIPPALLDHGGAPTDASCTKDDICYVLIRSYKSGYGNRAAIMELSDEKPRLLALFDAPLTLDNFEGLAVRQQFGKRYLYVASDDNFNNCFKSARANCQDTLILKFEIKTPPEAVPLIANAPRPDPQFKTVDVVLETTLGNITIALEMQRAPITAANFLRYVEEGRLDGTVFYRAMVLDREPTPNGLIQAGPRGARDRVLPPIAHEPTTLTGLSHVNAAVSMARAEPGTATGDFTIMLRDRTGLDANPASEDPNWRAGYAVFGHVVEGMEVVAVIHQSGNDPEVGSGVMAGQMIAAPVLITKARRVESPAAAAAAAP